MPSKYAYWYIRVFYNIMDYMSDWFNVVTKVLSDLLCLFMFLPVGVLRECLLTPGGQSASTYWRVKGSRTPPF